MRYVALISGWIAGRQVAKGEEIWLSPEEAKYEPVAPMSDLQPAKRRKSREARQ